MSDEDESLTYEQLRAKRIKKNEEMLEWVVFFFKLLCLIGILMLQSITNIKKTSSAHV